MIKSNSYEAKKRINMKSDRSEIKQNQRNNQTYLLNFIKQNSFCTFINCDSEGLFLSHINIIEEKELFFGHLSAGNPQAKQLKNGSKILAVFKDTQQGDRNSMAVHLHGSVRLIENDEVLAASMTNLISKFESERPTPWSIDWSDSMFKTQMNGIVGFYVVPEKIEKVTTPIADNKNVTILADVCPHKNVSLRVPVEKLSTFRLTPIYTPRYFVEKRQDILEEFISSQQSCIAIVYNESGCLNVHHANLSIVSENEDKLKLSGRLVTAGEGSQEKAGDTLKSIVVFNGAHTYISPTWYKTPHSVPTWNYITAHVHGEIKILDREIVGRECLLDVELEVSRIDGKYKLNQNRTHEDREGVISGLGASAFEADQEVCKLMQRFSSATTSKF